MRTREREAVRSRSGAFAFLPFAAAAAAAAAAPAGGRDAPSHGNVCVVRIRVCGIKRGAHSVLFRMRVKFFIFSE